MGYRKLDVGRNFVARAEYDSDLIRFVTELVKENGITAATFTAIGALKNAKLGFYDQDRHAYSETFVSSPHELLVAWVMFL